MCRASSGARSSAVPETLAQWFDWHALEVVLVARGGGEVYRVTHDDNTGILKVFAPGLLSPRQLEQQLLFAGHLARVGVRCCQAVRHVDGSLWGLLPDGRLAVLYERAPGRSVACYTPAQAEKLGEVVARMHASTLDFVHRARYPRLSLDWLLFGPLRAVFRELERHELSSAPLLAAADRLERTVEELEASVTWAICHGDLHYSNTYWDGGDPVLFDFDHSRFAPVALDVGFFCLLATSRRNRSAALQHCFLHGYQSAKLLSDADFRLVPAMMALFHLFALGHHCRYQHARYPAITCDYLAADVDALSSYGTARSLYALDGPAHAVLGGALDGTTRQEREDVRSTTAAGDA